MNPDNFRYHLQRALSEIGRDAGVMSNVLDSLGDINGDQADDLATAFLAARVRAGIEVRARSSPTFAALYQLPNDALAQIAEAFR